MIGLCCMCKQDKELCKDCPQCEKCHEPSFHTFIAAYRYIYCLHETGREYQSIIPPTEEELQDYNSSIYRISKDKIEVWQDDDKYWYDMFAKGVQI